MPWLPLSAASSGVVTDSVAALRSEPVGEVDPTKIPEPGELDTWKWDQHRLETDVAASLGFAVGSVKGSGRSRTVVAEFSRSKTIPLGKSQARYGVAARLVVNVLGLEAEGNLTLPFVAAQAQFNQLEAFANLTVEGYVGADAGDLFPEFTAFDVESYVKLMSALTAMKTKIGADVDNIRPAQLWLWTPGTGAEGVDDELTRSVGNAWALTRVKEGDTLERAAAKYRDRDDHVAHSAIQAVYSELGISGRDEEPSGEARARAKRLLDGYEMHHPRIDL